MVIMNKVISSAFIRRNCTKPTVLTLGVAVPGALGSQGALSISAGKARQGTSVHMAEVAPIIIGLKVERVCGGEGGHDLESPALGILLLRAEEQS